ncbi:hypothetical protein [Brachybacterium sp. YJGR34]|uniref:hypothetical protein n=1 Tax=Brachybacterium sp. YJGR34 TaxID=2059911 RepID=UPI0018E65F44|nr:hypothetical protein [Brachybacterium sp. YJGR34]
MSGGHRPRPLVLELPGVGLELSFGPGHEALAAEAAALWAHRADPAATVTARRAVRVPGDTPDPGALVIPPGPSAAYQLSGRITRVVIEALIGTRVLLHAGAVDHEELGPVLLVGPSGAGKSTAVAVLGHGGGYLSDELAIIDPTSRAVTGFPKPVSRIGPDGVKRDAAPAALGLRPTVSADAPERIVLLDRGPTATGTVRRLPLGEAMPRLIEQTSSLCRVPGGLAALAALVTRSGGALQVGYREAEELPALLADPPAAHDEDWEELPAGPARPAAEPAGALTAAPYDQALVLENGVLVLASTRAGHLPGLAGLVWERLRDAGGLDPDQLESVVAAELGAHPQSRTLLASTVDALVRGGWVVSAPRSP